MKNTYINEQVMVSELAVAEQIQFEKVGQDYPKSILVSFGLASIIIMIIGITPLILSYFIEDFALTFLAQLFILGICFLLAIGLIVFNYLKSKKISYAVREYDVVLRSGLVLLSEEVVPFNRVQHITLEEHFYYRPFGLCQIEIYTAANPGVLVIPGLHKKDGEKIKGFITEKIKEESKVTKASDSLNRG